MKAPVLIAALLFALALAQCLYYYGQLPDPMASHFGAGGQANAWSSRVEFFSVYLGVTLFTQIVILGLAFLLVRIPDRLFNLPNRDYWLMPERRQATLAYIQRQMGWSAAAVMVLMLVSLQLVIRANLSGGGQMETGWLWPLLGLFIAAMLAIPIRIVKRFSRR